MTMAALATLGLIALAFITGVRVGLLWARAGQQVDTLLLMDFDAGAVNDAADMATDSDETASELRLY